VEADRLKALRDRLNQVVNALHQPRRNALTAHYAIGIKIRDEALAAKVRLSWARADQHDEQQLQQLRDMAGLLGVQAKALGTLTDHPLQAIAQYEWSSQWQGDLVRSAGSLQAAAERVGISLAGLEKALGAELGVMSLPQLAPAVALRQARLGVHRTQCSFALEHDATDRLEAREEAGTRLKHHSAPQAKLRCQYAPLAWQALDADQLATPWAEANDSWW